jgi:hypothetical protein
MINIYLLLLDDVKNKIKINKFFINIILISGKYCFEELASHVFLLNPFLFSFEFKSSS